jgi:hypothetical protein
MSFSLRDIYVSGIKLKSFKISQLFQASFDSRI